jgi:HEPN domain-containing protein
MSQDGDDSAWRARQSSGTRLVLDKSEGAHTAFWRGAAEFYTAARQAPLRDSTPQYVLIFHAVELSLKAFLIGKGLQLTELRRTPFGHDLKALYDRARETGFPAHTEDTAKFITWINEYARDVSIRYDFSSDRTLPMAEVLFPIVEAFIAAAKPSKP